MQTIVFLWFELQVAQQCLRETFAESQVPEVDDKFRAHGLHDLLSQNTISTITKPMKVMNQEITNLLQS